MFAALRDQIALLKEVAEAAREHEGFSSNAGAVAAHDPDCVATNRGAPEDTCNCGMTRLRKALRALDAADV